MFVSGFIFALLDIYSSCHWVAGVLQKLNGLVSGIRTLAYWQLDFFFSLCLGKD